MGETFSLPTGRIFFAYLLTMGTLLLAAKVRGILNVEEWSRVMRLEVRGCSFAYLVTMGTLLLAAEVCDAKLVRQLWPLVAGNGEGPYHLHKARRASALLTPSCPLLLPLLTSKPSDRSFMPASSSCLCVATEW